MGCKLTKGMFEDMHDAVLLLLGDDIAKVANTPLAVRSDKGIDDVIYLDAEDGRILITGESFYRKNDDGEKPKGAKPTLSKKERLQLAEAFDALIGVASETGESFFDGYHKRSGKKMLDELETIFKKLAPIEMEALNY